MKFTEWKQIREGRFDDLDLGRKSVPQQILVFRRNMAANLEEMIADGELQPEMTLQQAIQFLKG